LAAHMATMKYRPLMILGAGSDVGKSLLVAGLCRLFRQEGVRVAPFKAQNMALNSFITPEGGEMGRSQVVQAQAAGLVPHVDMNPILLKPTAGVGAQVIVHGKVLGNFTSADYYRLKPKLVRQVMASFRRLAGEYELIILEGAGSAVELNLRKSDLVNFSMAKKAGAVAVLAADIDRGGVFAATIGSFGLLTRTERQVLKGFIINRFRGDPELFREGVEIIERRTARPVLGVVPFFPDLALPEEDSVPLERPGRLPGAEAHDRLAVGVVRLPHISNYTDFLPLEQDSRVALSYPDHRDSLAGLDLVILPGSKNTISDLVYLKETGLAGQIQEHARQGGRVLGICGGYQMLGEEVRDPEGLEGKPRTENGLGLLPVVTTLQGDKTTTQVQAEVVGLPGREQTVTGYEIHLGATEARGAGGPALKLTSRNGQPGAVPDGWVSDSGLIMGTYVHGLFDDDGFRQAFVSALLGTKPGSPEDAPAWSYQAFQEAQLDRLAENLRRHLDLARLWEIIRFQ
jgi:adenosylcobyric acid synthase